MNEEMSRAKTVRRRFRWSHYVRQRTNRRHWMPRQGDILGDIRGELAIIADRRAAD